jgi:hypothetical protein
MHKTTRIIHSSHGSKTVWLSPVKKIRSSAGNITFSDIPRLSRTGILNCWCEELHSGSDRKVQSIIEILPATRRTHIVIARAVAAYLFYDRIAISKSKLSYNLQWNSCIRKYGLYKACIERRRYVNSPSTQD